MTRPKTLMSKMTSDRPKTCYRSALMMNRKPKTIDKKIKDRVRKIEGLVAVVTISKMNKLINIIKKKRQEGDSQAVVWSREEKEQAKIKIHQTICLQVSITQ